MFGCCKSRNLLDSRVEIFNRTRPLTPPLGLPHRNKRVIPFESNYEVRQLIKGSRLLDLRHSLEWFATGPPWREEGAMRKEEEWLDGSNSCPVTLIVLAVSDREEINMSLTICTSIHLSLRHVYVLMFAAAIRAAALARRRRLHGASALGGTSHIFTAIIIVCVS